MSGRSCFCCLRCSCRRCACFGSWLPRCATNVSLRSKSLRRSIARNCPPHKRDCSSIGRKPRLSWRNLWRSRLHPQLSPNASNLKSWTASLFLTKKDAFSIQTRRLRLKSISANSNQYGRKPTGSNIWANIWRLRSNTMPWPGRRRTTTRRLAPSNRKPGVACRRAKTRLSFNS